MEEQEEYRARQSETANAVFLPSHPQYNRPSTIVTLGHYYPEEKGKVADSLVRESGVEYRTAASKEHRAVRRNLGWTKLINAFNAERQWPLKRFFALLDPILAPDIAIAVVPTHLGYQAFWPTRTLAKQLAEQGRVDATSCLVRHTTIRKITFGGPSTRALHRQTIRVENPQLIASRRVLLLDDITKSGASLMACRDLLLEAGATVVQPMALGRVIIGE